MMSFARKRSVNAAAATCFCLCESEAAAKGFYLRESKATAATQHDIGHSVVATGRGVLRLSSSLSADVFCTESVAAGTDVRTPAVRS
ncbi:hypothetical protein ACZ11_02155 [Lysinibacillus xylanilyticus]|uniref:Uncharacterized protein n=1 Tax=Lysinibacillus xylanilyticus TaxID=582475 RepID=A0A0K9FI78_9BACI|nr:hypothetical protein [Lysinibacillus xylanilyticus]KMY33902.1 hypothetical protein ACZ11_02155 [Lysinibacillus xylanilyticus]